MGFDSSQNSEYTLKRVNFMDVNYTSIFTSCVFFFYSPLPKD